MKRNLYSTAGMLNLITGALLLITSCTKDPVPVTGLTLDKTDATIQVGATSNLNVFITPVDADNKNIKWRSSDLAVATVADGTVTAVAIGETTITAVSESDTTIKATCAVLVTPSTGQIVQVSGDITTDKPEL
jgi:uncharacterized protein YjdB